VSVRDFLDDDGQRWTVAPGRDAFHCYIVSARGEQIPFMSTRGIARVTADDFAFNLRTLRRREALERDDHAEAEDTRGPELRRDRRGRVADESAPNWRRPKE
jgi:hypothetical protein